MRIRPEHVVEFFRQSVPEQFLFDTVRCLCAAYREAYLMCSTDFEKPERHDLLPILRRAIFEGSWRALASKHPRVTAKVELNYRRNCYHTEIVCGKVILTESAVDNPQRLVRDAVFRRTLALSNQLVLPYSEFEDENESEPRSALYAMLIHGAYDWESEAPAFVHIVFPPPDYHSGYVGRIDLLAQFGEMRIREASYDKELIPEDLNIRLRRDIIRGKENA